MGDTIIKLVCLQLQETKKLKMQMLRESGVKLCLLYPENTPIKSYQHKHELKKYNTSRYTQGGKWTQPYTKSYRQLRKSGSGETVFSGKNALIHYPISNNQPLKDIHMSTIIQTEQVICRIYM